ncbi:hypothetical protein GCM10007301_43120 [Azorhizobium oxalatiphilum]|uniref:Uncharacterized protein n=1 Tax=Azorhizobium oxalatiphilum TaxID=980631 RepID=A0A917CAR6_9HYPH|nr:hypothetical protein [Azorhizobium oxalatiphilum]GGF78501.1 hypothetical protein GCM10007301_43120 [Azorhizobium oxalatiphilum]
MIRDASVLDCGSASPLLGDAGTKTEQAAVSRRDAARASLEAEILPVVRRVQETVAGTGACDITFTVVDYVFVGISLQFRTCGALASEVDIMMAGTWTARRVNGGNAGVINANLSKGPGLAASVRQLLNAEVMRIRRQRAIAALPPVVVSQS